MIHYTAFLVNEEIIMHLQAQKLFRPTYPHFKGNHITHEVLADMPAGSDENFGSLF